MKLLVVFRFVPRAEKVKFSITELFFYFFFLSSFLCLFVCLFLFFFVYLFIYLFIYLENILRCTNKSDLN